MSNFTISSSYPVPSVMSRTEFEDIIKNLVPASDLIASSDLHISNNKIAIKAGGVDIDQLDLASSNSNLEDAGSGKIRVAQTMTGLTSVTSTSFSGALTGNASTATALQTSRTISLGGDLSGSASFDGTSDITLNATVDIDSVALGTDTTGNYVAAGATSGSGISGSVSSEGGTFTVTSNATSANTGSTIVLRDSSGNFTAGTITAALTGNASSATTLSAYGTAGQILATNSSENAVEWIDNTPSLEALTDTSISNSVTDGSILYYDGTSGQERWEDTDAIRVNSLGNVGIGGTAPTGNFELKVYGSQWILGDNSGTDTELYVQDPSAKSQVTIDGTTGTSFHAYTRTSGEAEIFLSTTASTVGSTNNSLNIRNTGTTSDFVVHNYDTTNGHTTGSGTALSIDNATGYVGIQGSPQTFPAPSSDSSTAPGNTSAALSVNGHMYVGYSLAFGTNARIDRMSAMNAGTSSWRDIFKGVTKFHTTLSGSITDSETTPITITVADSSDFGTSGTLQINSEQFTISGNDTSTNQITLDGRAQGSTSAQAHSSGDIVSHGSSNGGLLIDGYNSAHTVVAIRANDVNDGFSVVTSEGVSTGESEEVTFRQILKASPEGVVINEHGESAFDFRVEGDTNQNLLSCDASADAVGIGGAPTTGYDLTVHGVMKVAGTGGTELVVQDNSAKAVQITDGTTGSSQHIRSEGGNCILSLETDITSTSTNNAFVINNSGSETSFTVKDYNTGSSNENADVSFKINHSDATIVLMSLPTSASGLAAGTMYKVSDGSGGWTLKVA